MAPTCCDWGAGQRRRVAGYQRAVGPQHAAKRFTRTVGGRCSLRISCACDHLVPQGIAVNATLARVAYYAAQRWRGEPVDAVLRELEDSARWPAERLRELQWARARQIASYAYETVPFYRERFARAGVTPSDLVSWADWDRLPVLDKADIQEHAEALRSSRAPKGLVAATSGSSGTPVAVDRGHLSWAHAHANLFRMWRSWGVDCGDRYAYFWGVPIDPAYARIAARKDRFFNRIRCSAFTLDADHARAFHARLVRDRTRFAFGYPSAITQFADELRAANLDGRALGWRAVFTTAEVLRESQRERIGPVFGCPVVDGYGCAEIGVAGFDHPEGGMRVPVESVVVDYERTDDGAWGVLLTDLHNFRMPMLRYRVGDLVERPTTSGADSRWVAPPGSRCTLPLLGALQGRAGDTLVLADGRRLNANQPSYIFKTHGREGRVREYQFVQFEAGRIELRIVPGPAWNASWRPRLIEEVRQVLGVTVELRELPRIERRGRGKHRDFARAADLGES
jgi:phenylacetate-CoA ligase